MKHSFGLSMAGLLGIISPVAVAFSAPSSLEFVASQGVGQVYSQYPDNPKQHCGHETIEREREGCPRYDTALVDTSPLTRGGPWIAWYGVAAMLTIILGWVGLLRGGRRTISLILLYGGLSALLYIIYAVSY